MTSDYPNQDDLKIAAALYASRPGVLNHLRSTGRLPKEIPMGGVSIGLSLLIRARGTDINLEPHEELVYRALVRENRLPGGYAILLKPKTLSQSTTS